MKKRTKRGSLFTLLLGNYILFTALVVLIFIAAITLAILGNKLNLVDFEQIRDYESLLAEGRYEEFPTVRLIGKEGSIAVLDETGRVLYNSGKQELELSDEDIAYIPDAVSDYSITTKEIRTSDGRTNYEITMTSDTLESDIFILDETYKLLYASEDWLDTQLSKKQYLLLANQFFEDYTVNKFQFSVPNRQQPQKGQQLNAGGQYTLLLFCHTDAAFEELKKLGTMFSQGVIYFTIFYVLLMILLIFWLKRKINVPLRLLCSVFEDYRIGQPITQEYYGPKEFVNIFENFSAMAQRLEESERQKKSLEENRRKMIADIAHDFKTPISVIRGYAKAVADGIVPLQEQKKYLAIIDRKSARLNELIASFYEYSKMEHPQFQFHMEETDICNYFRDFVAEQYSELEIAGFEVEAEIPETHILCKIDRAQLKRAFANIVGNTVHHTAAGTTLYFELTEEKEQVILKLADNGSGIAPEIAEHIFTPFVTGDQARKGEGSGLGLSIARKIVEAHGGTIELHSDREAGQKWAQSSGNCSVWSTVFQITLPRC